MRRAVQLAEEARSRFLASGTSTTPPDIRIALSLGPFGASLSPGQEYGGVYPPPYGPQAYSSTRKNRNVFTPDERTQGAEDSAVTALAAWHLARLRAFADDMHTWNTIDMLAFETIPLRIEARAICKAVATLRESAPAKAWWLSAVFPSGCAPDAEAGSGVEALVHVLAGGPDGVGINCTPPEFVGALVQEMQAEVARGTWRPWLALYPNGGGVYDPVARTWGAGEGKGAGGWASGVADIVRRAEADGVFGRVVVGGCCKTTPDDIATLAKLVAHSTQ
jgi:homocysteine S-methyltransferase